ncbi:selenide, water dikinase SelD [bacterium DOLZORAL124_64_63]|nr:MAG: selenide, water dikinase SelD [bacterium DOLZORAL124_64_63]
MSQILEPIKAANPADLLVGFEKADDAAVYRQDAERAIVSTADFITPVVDDAHTFGRVAAANSLSDVYAMGGSPLMALNLLGCPPVGVPNQTLVDILAGGAEVCREAGCAVAGGHTVRDDEIKFGLSVTGQVHPDRILRNSTACPGDRLVLTKPLGTGALVAALKKNQVDAAGYDALVAGMTGLNRCGARLHEVGATACTDVTGFGLSGHALEMARGSGTQLCITTSALPLLPNAVALCAAGFTCGGTRSNASFTGQAIHFAADLEDGMIGLVHDPQTSGGLLFSVPADRLDEALDLLRAEGTLSRAVIGEVRPREADAPWLRFSR